MDALDFTSLTKEAVERQNTTIEEEILQFKNQGMQEFFDKTLFPEAKHMANRGANWCAVNYELPDHYTPILVAELKNRGFDVRFERNEFISNKPFLIISWKMPK